MEEDAAVCQSACVRLVRRGRKSCARLAPSLARSRRSCLSTGRPPPPKTDTHTLVPPPPPNLTQKPTPHHLSSSVRLLAILLFRSQPLILTPARSRQLDRRLAMSPSPPASLGSSFASLTLSDAFSTSSEFEDSDDEFIVLHRAGEGSGGPLRAGLAGSDLLARPQEAEGKVGGLEEDAEGGSEFESEKGSRTRRWADESDEDDGRSDSSPIQQLAILSTPLAPTDFAPTGWPTQESFKLHISRLARIEQKRLCWRAGLWVDILETSGHSLTGRSLQLDDALRHLSEPLPPAPTEKPRSETKRVLREQRNRQVEAAWLVETQLMADPVLQNTLQHDPTSGFPSSLSPAVVPYSLLVLSLKTTAYEGKEMATVEPKAQSNKVQKDTKKVKSERRAREKEKTREKEEARETKKDLAREEANDPALPVSKQESKAEGKPTKEQRRSDRVASKAARVDFLRRHAPTSTTQELLALLYQHEFIPKVKKTTPSANAHRQTLEDDVARQLKALGLSCRQSAATPLSAISVSVSHALPSANSPPSSTEAFPLVASQSAPAFPPSSKSSKKKKKVSKASSTAPSTSPPALVVGNHSVPALPATVSSPPGTSSVLHDSKEAQRRQRRAEKRSARDAFLHRLAPVSTSSELMLLLRKHGHLETMGGSQKKAREIAEKQEQKILRRLVFLGLKCGSSTLAPSSRPSLSPSLSVPHPPRRTSDDSLQSVSTSRFSVSNSETSAQPSERIVYRSGPPSNSSSSCGSSSVDDDAQSEFDFSDIAASFIVDQCILRSHSPSLASADVSLALAPFAGSSTPAATSATTLAAGPTSFSSCVPPFSLSSVRTPVY